MAFTPHYAAMQRTSVARRASQSSAAQSPASNSSSSSGGPSFGDLLPSTDLSDSIGALISRSPGVLRKQLTLAKTAFEDGVLNGGGGDGARVAPPTLAAFSQLAYLGCAGIGEPRSEAEIQRLMGVLSGEKRRPEDCVSVTLALPEAWDGELVLAEAETGAEMARFRLHRILFCARGRLGSSEADCFAFSVAQTGQRPDAQAELAYQLHVFRCLVPQAVGKVLLCFASAFRRQAPAQPSALPDQPADGPPLQPLSSSDAPELDFQLEAFLEVKEEDGKGGWALAPQEKNCFKLRRGREKRIVVVLQQVSGPRALIVSKCFGLLLAAGRNVRHSDMHLLDMQSMGRGQTQSVYVIEALWDPNAPQFDVLNTETPRDTRVFLTVAADVVLSGIHDPVRFSIEAKARILHQHERFWYMTRRPVVERYWLSVRKVEGDVARPAGSSALFEVAGCLSATERERRQTRVALGRSPAKAAQLVQPADDDESDADEPLLSGSGAVAEELSPEALARWQQTIEAWAASDERPANLPSLIVAGVPDSLRGQVWSLLSGAPKEPDIEDAYRLLLSKECEQEQVILRDIHRTFPAHDYFKEAGGVGQDALLKMSKAYALYDEEVGYCQGLSFLAASLLLHQKEEAAFACLVRIMFHYGLRDLFKPGFEALHLRFYQLERLIEDYIPDLHPHLYNLGVESHMYASQWFLTLFTAKFPLQMVFHIIDLFLSEGMATIFHISIALLKASKKELLQLDFEGVLKYFRVSLPRKYRTEPQARELIRGAIGIKISHKRLSKYEKEYMAMKEREAETQEPAERLERENLRLRDALLRLERENDDLAHELVTSKVQLRNALDAAEDSIERLQATVERLTAQAADLNDQNQHLLQENEQVKEMCRKELERLESERERSQGIVGNYKHICSDLSERLEAAQRSGAEERRRLRRRLGECAACAPLLADEPSSDASQAPSSGPADEARPDGATAESPAEARVRQLELELAQTKLVLVETQCQSQDLSHALAAAHNELDASRKTWFRKTVAAVRDSLPRDSGPPSQRDQPTPPSTTPTN